MTFELYKQADFFFFKRAVGFTEVTADTLSEQPHDRQEESSETAPSLTSTHTLTPSLTHWHAYCMCTDVNRLLTHTHKHTAAE